VTCPHIRTAPVATRSPRRGGPPSAGDDRRRRAHLTAREDLPADTVYKITKAFWEGAEKRRASTPWLRHITPEFGVREGGMRLHPGALRYYKEVGVKVPEGSM